MQRLQFLEAQPWFVPSTEPWPCSGDELFVGLVTFELAGAQRAAADRHVMMEFAAPLLGSRTQSQFRLALLRKARLDGSNKRPRGGDGAPDNSASLFARVGTAAGHQLHGQLLHTQITRMSDNVQDGMAVPQAPFLRLEFGDSVALVLRALPETPIPTAVVSLRRTIECMLKALSPDRLAAPPHPTPPHASASGSANGAVSPLPSGTPVAQLV
jgi:hypothetical protein|eukprot:Transcript_21541.p1 GENE.Transcript_21541~~Transcript_21541.p1  ORF type:complete len:230 (-),score=38.75 Transcript_21541:869-1507(-)